MMEWEASQGGWSTAVLDGASDSVTLHLSGHHYNIHEESGRDESAAKLLPIVEKGPG